MISSEVLSSWFYIFLTTNETILNISLHGTEPFLRSWQSLQEILLPTFMEPEVSLPCLQEPYPYPNPDQSSPHFLSLFPWLLNTVSSISFARFGLKIIQFWKENAVCVRVGCHHRGQKFVGVCCHLFTITRFTMQVQTAKGDIEKKKYRIDSIQSFLDMPETVWGRFLSPVFNWKEPNCNEK
jgi:hypothetical protein